MGARVIIRGGKALKIILHIGMTKTGTTALQTAFFNARAGLLERGIYYPDGGEGRENHRYLSPLFMALPDLPRSTRRHYRDDAEAAVAGAEAMWGAICRQVAASRPEILLLSSEYFFTNPSKTDYRAFHRRLAELSDDIEIVLYVREPASRFAARIQQGAKHERPAPAIDGGQLEREIPLVEEAFGRKVDVRLFDRNALIEHDIVSDFIARSIAPVVGGVTVPTCEENESISAEATALLVDADHGSRIAQTRASLGFARFRDLVRRIDDATPGKKAARLRPEVAEDVRRAGTDLHWLRERYGVTFPAIDYAGVDGAAPAYDAAQMKAAALLNVDSQRLSAMKAQIGSTARSDFGVQPLARRMMSFLGLSSGAVRSAAGRRS